MSEERRALWAPWRMAYILREHAEGCVFCDQPRSDNDREKLVVARAERVFVMLNLYPYNNGHLLVVPYRHIADLTELEDDESAELMRVSQRCVEVVRATMHPDGFNLGINIGASAGAGIADHLHLHIVPRWSGDTNFMPVVGGVRCMPDSLDRCYELLAQPLRSALQ